jgi:stage V sporulation protein B
MKEQTTTKGFTILSISNIVCKVLAIVYLPLQTLIIGNEGNGIVSSAYNIYLLIYLLTNAGLPSAISKLVSEQVALGNYKGSRKIFKITLRIMIVMGFAFAILMAVGAPIIARITDQPKSYLVILMLAPTLLFTTTSSALRGYFQGRRNMMPTAVSQILEQIVNTIFTVVFAAVLIRYGLVYACAGTTIGTSVGAIAAASFLTYLYISTKKQRTNELATSSYDGPHITTKVVIKELVKYSLPAIIGAVATSSVNIIDSLLCMLRLQAAGLSEAQANVQWGVYSNQFQRVSAIAYTFSSAMAVTIIPAISAARARGDIKEIKRKISDAFFAIFLFTVPCIAGLTFLSQPILTFIFFRNDAGADMLIVGTWIFILMSIINVQSSALIALGKPFVAPINLIVSMVLKIILTYILVAIPGVGILGAIAGTAASWFLAVVLNHYSIKKSVRGKLNYPFLIVKPAVVSLVMGIGALITFKIFDVLISHITSSRYVINDVSLLISIGVGALIYVSLIIKIGSINTDDILKLPFGRKIYRVLLRIPFIRNDLERSITN